MSNWFVLYCAPRTLANTLETALTVLALDYYSSIGRAKSNISSQRSGLNSFRLQWILISIAVLIRPTAALIWLPLVLMQFFECSEKSTHLFTSEFRKFILSPIKLHFRAALPCGLISLLTALALDSIYYGRPTLSLWNFIRFNALQGGSAYFGTHPWHWYLTNGLPPLLTVSTPFLLTHLFLVTRQVHRRRISKRYLWTAIAYIALHSLITHKEHRFVLPTLPLLMPYLGVEVLERIPRLWGAWRSRFKLFVISVNMTLALYFGRWMDRFSERVKSQIFHLGLIHQRGSTQVMHSLIQQISSKTVSTDMSEHASSTIHILQLMPCFSMPQYAALHLYGTQVKIRMLECTSSVEKHFTDKAKITNKYGVEKRKEIDSNSITDDEADRFHNNPLDWLHERSSDSDSMRIDIVVAFEKTYRRVQTFFEQRNFTVVKRIFHTHFPLSDRQDRWIVVAIKSE